MGPTRPRPVVLDAGSLVAFERNNRAVRRLIELAVEYGASVHVPAGVVAQVWRDGARQVRLARLLKSRLLDVRVLDLDEAKAVGALCGATGTADIVDASVVLLARRHRAAVITSDPDDMRHLDPQVPLVIC